MRPAAGAGPPPAGSGILPAVRVAGLVAGKIRLLTGAQARWAGADPVSADGGLRRRVYFANHRSHLDAPVVWASLPGPVRDRVRPVAAADTWGRTAVHRFLAGRVFRAVLIDRHHVSAHGSNPIAAMVAALDGGDSLILFPEGTRSGADDGGPAPFKPGLYHLAKQRPGVELVPVHLENLNRILPKGDWLVVPLLAAVSFGRPLDPVQDGEDKAAFLGRAHAAVVALERRDGGGGSGHPGGRRRD